MKYQDIINHLNSLHLKSTKGIINAMEQLLPEFKYEKTGDSYCVYARYPYKREGNFILAFTVVGEKGYDGSLKFNVESASIASMRPKGGKFWEHVSPIVDTDQDIVRCKRKETKFELMYGSYPFSFESYGHNMTPDSVRGTRTLLKLKQILWVRSDTRKDLDNYKLPYQICSMLDHLQSLADQYSRAYDPQLFWKELSEAYATASSIQTKDIEAKQKAYNDACEKVREYLNRRKEVSIF